MVLESIFENKSAFSRVEIKLFSFEVRWIPNAMITVVSSLLYPSVPRVKISRKLN